MRVFNYAFLLGLLFLSQASLAKPSNILDQALEELSVRLEDPDCTLETMTESAELLQNVVDAAATKSKDTLAALLEKIQNTPVRSDGTPMTKDERFWAPSNLLRVGKVQATVARLLTKHFTYNTYKISATGAGIGAAAAVGGSGNQMVGTAVNQFGKAFMLSASIGVGAFPGVGVKLAVGRIVGSTYFDENGVHSEDWGHSGDRLRGGSFIVGGMKLDSPFSVGGAFTIYFVSVGTIGDFPFYVNAHLAKGPALNCRRDYSGLKKSLGIK